MIFSKNQVFLPLPKLHAPTLTANGTIVTVTNPETNGKFADGWELYEAEKNAPVVAMKFTEGMTYNLEDYFVTSGNYNFYAKVTGENFIRSDASNVIVITV